MGFLQMKITKHRHQILRGQAGNNRLRTVKSWDASTGTGTNLQLHFSFTVIKYTHAPQ